MDRERPLFCEKSGAEAVVSVKDHRRSKVISAHLVVDFDGIERAAISKMVKEEGDPTKMPSRRKPAPGMVVDVAHDGMETCGSLQKRGVLPWYSKDIEGVPHRREALRENVISEGHP